MFMSASTYPIVLSKTVCISKPVLHSAAYSIPSFQCVICVNAKATMQTSPCGHRVVCRKCFVKTIQMAVSQRLLPLRCVICRAKILRLKQSGTTAGGVLLPTSASHYSVGGKSWVVPNSASSYTVGSTKWVVPGSASSYSVGKAWVVPSSASQYSMGSHGSVPNSASLYSMTSGSSSLSGVSSVSSATTGSQSSNKSGKCVGSRMGYPRQPTGSLRKSQTQAMKLRIQEYKEPVRSNKEQLEKPARLPPIKEFQREFRAGKERTASSSSTRIRCAQKIVTQLESPLLKNSTTTTTTTTSTTTNTTTTTTTTTYFRSPLKPANKEDKRKGEKRKEDKKQDERKEKDDNLDNKKKEDKQHKKSEKKETKTEKKEEKKEVKIEKDGKTDKKESKKEVKTEKKESKKEIKTDKKKEKKDAKMDKKEKD
ncbi:hypothetical protein Cfor_12176 [Coptotermes formosanus]|uniref:RING-type domain-containing protein n=1 Tax=Coptotermes formosanus TaxID=36987 RepID=A0A6L2Q2A6_COPFO|nr:hypothetical protein Cfor_12176 [Coptotermes formosanus]